MVKICTARNCCTFLLFVLAAISVLLRATESEYFISYKFKEPINTQAWELGREKINRELRDLLTLTNSKIGFVELLQRDQETGNLVYTGVYGIGYDPYYNNTIINQRKQEPIENHVGHEELMDGKCVGEFVEGTDYSRLNMEIDNRLELYCPIFYRGDVVGFYGVIDTSMQNKGFITSTFVRSRINQIKILQDNFAIALFK